MVCLTFCVRVQWYVSFAARASFKIFFGESDEWSMQWFVSLSASVCMVSFAAHASFKIFFGESDERNTLRYRANAHVVVVVCVGNAVLFLLYVPSFTICPFGIGRTLSLHFGAATVGCGLVLSGRSGAVA